MKKVTLKASKVQEVYNVLKGAKYGKMADQDKVKVFKAVCKMKSVANDIDGQMKDAAESMKPEGFDEAVVRFNETQDRQRAGQKDNLPMTPEEAVDFVYKTLNPYNKLIADATKEAGDKEVELEFEPLSEDGLMKLMDSNDWTFEHAALIGDVICG